MDELIVLLIRGIASLLGDKKKTGVQPQRRPIGAQQPVTQGPLAPRRQAAPAPRQQPPKQQKRRAAPTSVRAAIASPIMTGGGRATPASPAARAISAGPLARAATAGHGQGASAATTATGQASAMVDLRRRLTPAALRQQIVLSEILMPPLALRD